jgi:hypothetical protein
MMCRGFLVGGEILFRIWGGGGCFGLPKNSLAKCLQARG